MKKRLLSVAFLMGAMAANAQVGIGTATPNKSAELLIEAKNRGLLIPNVALTNTTDKVTITNGNVESLLVYATTPQGDITPGYYYWDGAKWARLTADKDIPQLVSNNILNSLKLDGNKLTSTVNGKVSAVELTENSVVSSKGITGTGIVVEGGANATLKDVKLSIADGAITPEKMAAGKPGTVLVTDKDGSVKWVKEDAAIIKDMVKANETITTLKDNGNGTFTYYNESDYGKDGQLKPGATGTPFDANTLNVTSADGVYTFTDKSGKELAKIDTNAKASGYDNGTFGLTSKDVQGAIDELVGKINKVAGTKGTLSSTDIVVTDGKDAILKDVTLAIAAGAVTEDKIGQGAVTEDKIKAGKDGQVLVTVKDLTTGETSTKWIDKKDATSNKLEAKGDKLVSTVNGQPAELKLEGDVILKDGKTEVSKLQGNDLATANVAEGEVLSFEGGKWINKVPTVNTDNVTNGKALTSTDKTIEIKGSNATALLKDVQIDVANGAITADKLAKDAVTSDKIKDGAVSTGKIEAGKDGQVLVTVTENGKEVTKWMPANDLGNTVTAGNGLTKTGNEIKLGGKLTEKTTLTTTPGKELAIKGLEDVKTNPSTNNIVLTDPITGELKQTSAKNLLEDTIAKGGSTDELKAKTLKGEGITVTAGTTVGTSLEVVNALLKDVILGIADGAITTDKIADGAVTPGKLLPGREGQVLVTEGGTTKWVDKDAIVTTNVFTSIGNDMTSNVNGESTTVDIINSVSNALDKDNKLVTTVNGKAGEGIDLTPAIQAGQKTTTVTKGSDKVTVVETITDKNTEYKVDVVEANIKLENLGGQLPADKLKPGTEGQVLVTVTEKDANGNDVIGADGKPVSETKWVDKIDATTNDLKLENGKLVSTVNGQPATLDLTNQVTKEMLKPGSVTKEKIAADVAGNGLGKNADGSLEVNAGNGITIVDDKVTVNAGTGLSFGTDGKLNVDFPTATANKAGVVKPGKGLEVATDGTLTVNYETAKTELAQGKVSSTTILVNNGVESLNSTFNNVALEIKGGDKDGQVLTSDKDGKVTWTTPEKVVLDGDVTGEPRKTTVSAIQGTPVKADGTKTDGQALVFDGSKWVPGTPNVTVDKITDAKDLTTDGIIVVEGATPTEAKGSLLAAAKLSIKEGGITAKELANNAVTPEKVQGGKDGEVLTTTGTGDTAKVEWKKPVVDASAVTNGQALTTDGIILVNTVAKLEKSVLLDAKLSIANNAITADKLKAGDTNQILTTVDNAGTKTVEWKTPVVDITKKGDLTSKTNLLTVDKGAGVVLQNVSLTVNQGNFELNQIGGSLNVNQITAGNNNQVLTTVDNGGIKTVVWKDKEKPTTVTGSNTETGDVEVIPGTGDKANEFTVNVKSAMPKVFYMPPVVFDTSNKNEGKVQTRNLHDEYMAQFANVKDELRSVGAPVSIPNTATATDLHYYVTYHDNTVVEIVSISNDGKLKYKVIGDSTPATFMTIVFVVK
ncbi:hypothetical protein [Myroides sp. N17-2]|uniref:hypothetical protein n=1 Tax=Myroides sp. N17-2 TaxID=2030799 RepID=UPI000EFB8D8C|nr:hypothetical protein [Myroides sp. N17-2]